MQDLKILRRPLKARAARWILSHFFNDHRWYPVHIKYSTPNTIYLVSDSFWIKWLKRHGDLTNLICEEFEHETLHLVLKKRVGKVASAQLDRITCSLCNIKTGSVQSEIGIGYVIR